jgi:hypothetical protein
MRLRQLLGKGLTISLALAAFWLRILVMSKRALWAGAGLLGFCFSLFAQQADQPDVLRALNDNFVRFPSLALSDGTSFTFASVVETTAPDFLPPLKTASVTAIPRRATAQTAMVDDPSKDAVTPERSNLFDYATGEIGFAYGRSTGKFDRQVEAGYILGEVGNDHFQISAGAAYEHSSGSVPRFGH